MAAEPLLFFSGLLTKRLRNNYIQDNEYLAGGCYYADVRVPLQIMQSPVRAAPEVFRSTCHSLSRLRRACRKDDLPGRLQPQGQRVVQLRILPKDRGPKTGCLFRRWRLKHLNVRPCAGTDHLLSTPRRISGVFYLKKCPVFLFSGGAALCYP